MYTFTILKTKFPKKLFFSEYFSCHIAYLILRVHFLKSIFLSESVVFNRK